MPGYEAFTDVRPRTVQDWRNEVRRLRGDAEALGRLWTAAKNAGVNPALLHEIAAAGRRARPITSPAVQPNHGDGVVPDAVCGGTATDDNGQSNPCGVLLLRLSSATGTAWEHLRDRCVNCWDTNPPAFGRCEWATQHDRGLCTQPQPATCAACGSVVNPEIAIGGHTACAAPLISRCCGCCGGGDFDEVDPDAVYDAVRDAQAEAGERR